MPLSIISIFTFANSEVIPFTSLLGSAICRTTRCARFSIVPIGFVSATKTFSSSVSNIIRLKYVPGRISLSGTIS